MCCERTLVANGPSVVSLILFKPNKKRIRPNFMMGFSKYQTSYLHFHRQYFLLLWVHDIVVGLQAVNLVDGELFGNAKQSSRDGWQLLVENIAGHVE